MIRGHRKLASIKNVGLFILLRAVSKWQAVLRHVSDTVCTSSLKRLGPAA